jgi:hypothetical protein
MDRQTDITKLRVTFCNFAKMPKTKQINKNTSDDTLNGSSLSLQDHLCIDGTLDSVEFKHQNRKLKYKILDIIR